MLEFNRSEQSSLKILLSYDPYLDPKLIPSSKEDEKTGGQSEAISEGAKQALKKITEDKYADVIMAEVAT